MHSLDKFTHFPLSLVTRPTERDWALYWADSLVMAGTLQECLDALTQACVKYRKEALFDINRSMDVLMCLLGLHLPSEEAMSQISQNISGGQLSIQGLQEGVDIGLIQRVCPEYNSV